LAWNAGLKAHAAALAALREAAAAAGRGRAADRQARWTRRVGGGDAQSFFELRAAAIRTRGTLVTTHEKFEIVMAALASVFVDRHRALHM